MVDRTGVPPEGSLAHDSKELYVLYHRAETKIGNLEDEVRGLEAEGQWWARRGGVCDYVATLLLVYGVFRE